MGRDETLAIVNNFAKMLLQIEQSVERRFLQAPLGGGGTGSTSDTQQQQQQTLKRGAEASGSLSNVINKTLTNWERSLAASTTLSQVFVHLQTLDESIAWSKSVLNARCCVCKKKRDADKMLLCAKCERGHHVYCLRPALTMPHQSEWLCTKCKPKDVDKTPRHKTSATAPLHSNCSSAASDICSEHEGQGVEHDTDTDVDKYIEISMPPNVMCPTRIARRYSATSTARKRRGMLNGGSRSHVLSNENEMSEENENCDEGKKATRSKAIRLNGHQHKSVNFHHR